MSNGGGGGSGVNYPDAGMGTAGTGGAAGVGAADAGAFTSCPPSPDAGVADFDGCVPLGDDDAGALAQ